MYLSTCSHNKIRCEQVNQRNPVFPGILLTLMGPSHLFLALLWLLLLLLSHTFLPPCLFLPYLFLSANPKYLYRSVMRLHSEVGKRGMELDLGNTVTRRERQVGEEMNYFDHLHNGQ